MNSSTIFVRIGLDMIEMNYDSGRYIQEEEGFEVCMMHMHVERCRFNQKVIKSIFAREGG